MSQAKIVQRTVIMIRGRVGHLNDTICRNTIALVGTDKLILKSGTITNIGNEDTHNINATKLSMSLVVRVASANPSDLPQIGRSSQVSLQV